MLNCLEKGPKQDVSSNNNNNNSNNNDNYNYNNNYDNITARLSKEGEDRSLIPPHRRRPDEQHALTHALTEVTDLERSLLQADKDAIGFATKILDAVGNQSPHRCNPCCPSSHVFAYI